MVTLSHLSWSQVFRDSLLSCIYQRLTTANLVKFVSLCHRTIDVGLQIDAAYTDQLDHVVTKGNQLNGLLKQIAGDIANPIGIKTLYCNLVRPVLQYDSVEYL